ncbi:MAG TPA: hypothetical protein VF610_06830, partial [Segetibacter sp.]
MLTAITPPGTVILQMVQHRGSNWILIGGKDAMRYSSAIRKVSGRKYSATRRSWLMPPNRQSYNELTLVLRDKAIIDISALKAGATTSKENVVTTGLLNKVIDK